MQQDTGTISMAALSDMQILESSTNLKQMTLRLVWENSGCVTHIDASKNALCELPPELGCFTSVSSLQLKYNCFTRIVLPELPQLAELDLSFNPLSELEPDKAFAGVPNLRSLKLKFAWLTEFPMSSPLTALRSLNLAGNQLTDLELGGLATLTQLRKLNLSGNRLCSLHPCLGLLTELRKLKLQRNDITELPRSISRFTSLELLDLYVNKISELPRWLVDLPRLVYICFKWNLITTVPASFVRLCTSPSRTKLDIRDNLLRRSKLPRVYPPPPSCHGRPGLREIAARRVVQITLPGPAVPVHRAGYPRMELLCDRC